jgi:hypothetical protein
MPWWAWAVTGAAALVVIAGLIAVAGFSMGAFPAAVTPTSAPPSPTLVPPTSTFTPTPVPPTSTPTPVPSPTPTSTPVPPDPAFGNFVVALGVEDPSTPFLTGEVFDWNAKAVYVLFDYEGMQNGPEWSVVWMRNGEEVEREEGPWDVERYGAEGTRWVVTRAPVVGDVLFGGAYTVTLAIEGDVAGEATFRIQYYATPTP